MQITVALQEQPEGYDYVERVREANNQVNCTLGVIVCCWARGLEVGVENPMTSSQLDLPEWQCGTPLRDMLSLGAVAMGGVIAIYTDIYRYIYIYVYIYIYTRI